MAFGPRSSTHISRPSISAQNPDFWGCKPGVRTFLRVLSDLRMVLAHPEASIHLLSGDCMRHTFQGTLHTMLQQMQFMNPYSRQLDNHVEWVRENWMHAAQLEVAPKPLRNLLSHAAP